MKLALFGDVHDDLSQLARWTARAAAAGAGAAIQVGDLGFTADRLDAGRPLARLPIPVLALCGNHEDHAFLGRARASGLATAWAAQGLIYQPRGSLVCLDGCRIGFLGGALHSDQPQVAVGGNLITSANLAEAQAAFAARPPDLIATHSCPAGLGLGMSGTDGLAERSAIHIKDAGYDGGPANDCGEPALTRLWQGLPRRPALWIFGHFHVFHQHRIDQTLFLSLPALDHAQGLCLWDTKAARLEFA